MIGGSKQEIENLLTTYPAIGSHIPANHRLSCGITGSNELTHYVFTYLQRHQFRLSLEAKNRVRELIERDYSSLML